MTAPYLDIGIMRNVRTRVCPPGMMHQVVDYITGLSGKSIWQASPQYLGSDLIAASLTHDKIERAGIYLAKAAVAIEGHGH
jgi:hypothetical protein